MLWQKAKAVSERPSVLLGLESDSYIAYCVDEAVIYFGLALEGMLEDAGAGRPGKEERRAKMARDRLMNSVFGKKETGSGYADPALMFT
jgi:hypothetical protein